LRDDFMSHAERSFYGVLTQVVGNRYTVLAKVRLADILYVPRSGNKAWASQQNKINQKHVDFLLCEPNTMTPQIAIELDDASHSRKDRTKRDEFVDSVFTAAGLSVAHVPVKSSYTAQDIQALMAPVPSRDLGSPHAAPPSELGPERSADSQKTPSMKSQTASPGQETIPKCPKCGAEMVLRTAAKGPHKGEQFYGCSAFPKCRGVVLVSI
jgi:predicted RNA-binding Zn-ribbon protein involved in translation (DUF1610 family)